MRYLRARRIAEMLCVSESTVWRWVVAGKLPKPLKLSKRVTVWREDEINAAIEAMAGAA